MAAPQRKFQQTYIREWRKHRGLTLGEVADRLDMTPGHISMLERGHAATLRRRWKLSQQHSRLTSQVF
jgi:transcriptional regulator with XRE-family HTH domain